LSSLCFSKNISKLIFWIYNMYEFAFFSIIRTKHFTEHAQNPLFTLEILHNWSLAGFTLYTFYFRNNIFQSLRLFLELKSSFFDKCFKSFWRFCLKLSFFAN